MNHQLDFLLQNAELKIVEFDMNCRTEMRTFKRILPCYMMSYHKKGSAKLRIGTETYDIQPGSIIYVPMNVEHDHYKTRTDETEFLWWHFTLQIAGVMDVMKMFQIPFIFKLNDAETFERTFMQFMEATSGSRPLLLTAILKQAKALELLYMILDSALNQQELMGSLNQSQSFLNLLARIVQHPQEQLSLQSLAEELHMHPTYICNRFKELFGKSPMQVQREMKIQRAKTLLETSEMSITEIAQALGSNEPQNFTRLFKSYVGVSPTQYRNLKLKWRDTN